VPILGPSPIEGEGFKLGAVVRTKRASDQPGAAVQQQALWFELMQFYIREAWLLDERRH